MPRFGRICFQKSCKIPYPSKHLAFSRIPLYIGQIPDSNKRTIGEDGSWSRIPAPFSRQSRIPTISHLYPEYRFLSQYRIPCHYFCESRFPKSGKISYPVKTFCVILFTKFRVIFRSIPGCMSRVLFKTLFSCLLFVRKFDCFQVVTQAARKKKNLSTPATSSRTYDFLVTQRVHMWLRTLRTLRLGELTASFLGVSSVENGKRDYTSHQGVSRNGPW